MSISMLTQMVALPEPDKEGAEAPQQVQAAQQVGVEPSGNYICIDQQTCIFKP